MSDERLDLLGQVAVWYYEDNLGQTAIAKRIGRSRSMVSRMLQEAREQGLVEIKVNYPLKRNTELESRLCQLFNLSQAWILANPPNDAQSLLRRVGRLAARCLKEKLQDDMTIGIEWGTTLYQVVRAMPNMPLKNAKVIQIIGAVGHEDPMVDGSELSRWLSQKLNASYRSLSAPLLVENATIAQSLFQERSIAETLSQADQVDITLIGLGAIDLNLASLYRTGHLTETALSALTEAGSVGYILCHQIDAYGNILDVPLNRCIISQQPEVLRDLPMVIAVVGNVAKAPVTLAALRGGYIDILVTDVLTAATVIDLHTN